MDDFFLRNRRRQYRNAPDDELALEARIELAGEWLDAAVLDTSAAGIGLELRRDVASPEPGDELPLQLRASTLSGPIHAESIVRFASRVSEAPDGSILRLGLEIEDVEGFYHQIIPGLLAQFNRRIIQRLDTVDEDITLDITVRGQTGSAAVQNLSTYGMCLLISPTMPVPYLDESVVLSGVLPMDDYAMQIAARVRHVAEGDDSTRIGIEYDREACVDYDGIESSIAMFAIRFQRASTVLPAIED